MWLSVASLDLFKEPAFDCDETPPRLLRETKASPFDNIILNSMKAHSLFYVLERVHLIFGNFRCVSLLELVLLKCTNGPVW